MFHLCMSSFCLYYYIYFIQILVSIICVIDMQLLVVLLSFSAGFWWLGSVVHLHSVLVDWNCCDLINFSSLCMIYILNNSFWCILLSIYESFASTEIYLAISSIASDLNQICVWYNCALIVNYIWNWISFSLSFVCGTIASGLWVIFQQIGLDSDMHSIVTSAFLCY